MTTVNPLAVFINADPTVMGLPALERARQAGYSDTEIVKLANQHGLRFGEKAAAALQAK
jgi:hypothetical protein